MLLHASSPLPWVAQGALTGGGISALLRDTGYFGRVILLLLLVFSVVSWAIMLERWVLFRRFRDRSLSFMRKIDRMATASEAHALARQEKDSALARICLAGERALECVARSPERRELAAGASGRAAASARTLRAEDLPAIQRALEKAAGEEVSYLEARLSFLATTGSVSPFVGLLGTVWGVMTSFHQMGLHRSPDLAVVAPGIAEALIATAAGLAAAIPAVVGYNYYVGRVRRATQLMDGFILEYQNLIDREFRR